MFFKEAEDTDINEQQSSQEDKKHINQLNEDQQAIFTNLELKFSQIENDIASNPANLKEHIRFLYYFFRNEQLALKNHSTFLKCIEESMLIHHTFPIMFDIINKFTHEDKVIISSYVIEIFLLLTKQNMGIFKQFILDYRLFNFLFSCFTNPENHDFHPSIYPEMIKLMTNIMPIENEVNDKFPMFTSEFDNSTSLFAQAFIHRIPPNYSHLCLKFFYLLLKYIPNSFTEQTTHNILDFTKTKFEDNVYSKLFYWSCKFSISILHIHPEISGFVSDCLIRGWVDFVSFDTRSILIGYNLLSLLIRILPDDKVIELMNNSKYFAHDVVDSVHNPKISADSIIFLKDCASRFVAVDNIPRLVFSFILSATNYTMKKFARYISDSWDQFDFNSKYSSVLFFSEIAKNSQLGQKSAFEYFTPDMISEALEYSEEAAKAAMDFINIVIHQTKTKNPENFDNIMNMFDEEGISESVSTIAECDSSLSEYAQYIISEATSNPLN